MTLKYILLGCLIIISSSEYKAQPNNGSIFSIGFYNLKNISGSLTFKSDYRYKKTILSSGFTEEPTTAVFSGELSLNTNSYIWHPNFMKLDINLDYNPSTKRDRYITIPDRSESVTAEKIGATATFFCQRPVCFTFFSNFSHNFISREYTTNVETYRKDFGGNFYYTNTFLPVSLNYLNEDWKQNEIQAERQFINKRQNVSAELSKSFYKNDNHSLSFSYDDYKREYSPSAIIRNKISGITLRNDIPFDDEQRNVFNSLLWYSKQTGSESYKRFLALENLRIQLPLSFNFEGSFQYNTFNQNFLNSKELTQTSRLQHQLFSSLQTFIYYEYAQVKQTAYNEIRNTAGGGINYIKKIPTGTLNISYEYRQRNEERNSQPVPLIIVNEEHKLDDSKIVLLNTPSINANSIFITDETETIIYQLNIDYIIISRGDFIEIKRLLGGQIANGTNVFIDYYAEQITSYKFTSLNNSFKTNLVLFDRLIELYFRLMKQDYKQLEYINPGILKTIDQKSYGFVLNIDNLSAGVELDDFKSNIIPYRSIRYFFNDSRSIMENTILFTSANYNDYSLVENNEKQKYFDFTAGIIQRIGLQSQIEIEGSHRIQNGRSIDLKLTTAHLEFSTHFRQISFALGIDGYKRDYLNERIDFLGGYIKIQRNF